MVSSSVELPSSPSLSTFASATINSRPVMVTRVNYKPKAVLNGYIVQKDLCYGECIMIETLVVVCHPSAASRYVE